MGERQLLDCTLRDGGYINDWEFGHDRILEIFERLVSSKVEYIEIGFLDERRRFDINRTIMPNTEAVNKIFSGVKKKDAIVLAMIDYGTCGIQNLQSVGDTFIDGIRVIFKEHLMYEALDFCRKVKALGYKVFAQMVSVTTYTDEKLVEYAKECNKVMPYATSMVDTYGLLDDDDLMRIFRILDKELNPQIKVGYHAHNNFQLGYANAKVFLSCDTKRDLLADGTLYGMGKSAGNAPIELLMMYMNGKHNANYEIDQALESIDHSIMEIYQQQAWGYNMFFYIAANTKCHPNYVSYLMNKKTLSVRQILDILQTIQPEKKLMYDAKYVEQLYLGYQEIRCDDANDFRALQDKLAGSELLLVGPGSNIERQKSKVQKFIHAHRPIVIAVNFIPKEIRLDYVFLTKAKRYRQLIHDRQNSMNASVDIIATSNVTKTAGKFQYVLNYGSLIDRDTDIIDNSLVMLLKVLDKLGIKKVNLAGFDGYSRRTDNHFDVSRDYSYVKEKADYLNAYVRGFLENLEKDGLHVEFVTRSHYQKINIKE